MGDEIRDEEEHNVVVGRSELEQVIPVSYYYNYVMALPATAALLPSYTLTPHVVMAGLQKANADDHKGTCCSVCLDDFRLPSGSEVARLRCSHVFHVKCISTWLQKRLHCPLCRSKLSYSAPNNTISTTTTPPP